MCFSPSIRHVSRSKIHIYSCSQHILMTTITPTTSIKSSISFYSKSKSLSEYGSKIKQILPFNLLKGKGEIDVNVTSIICNTRTHILIFLYKTNLCFDLWAEEGSNRCGFLPFPSTQYEITICFMNRSLLFSNDDWIVSRLLFHNYYLLIWLSIIVRKGIDTNF